MKNPTTFLIDGIDRLGKSTLCKNIKRELGHYQLIHSSKPEILDYYKAYPHGNDVDPLQLHQKQLNKNMWKLIQSEAKLIFDRTHLGEMVYAPLYRGYSGDYVYTYETSNCNARLILLITTNFDMLEDDGESFDWDNKVKEQKLFLSAFNKSNLSDKVIIDVHNGNGGYKSETEILKEALKVDKLLYFKEKSV